MEEAPAEEAAPAEEGGGFEGLMAAPAEAGPPAKRDEDMANEYEWVKVKRKGHLGQTQTTTSKSNGKWHTPVTADARKNHGPRKKNMMSQAGHKQLGRRGTELGFDFNRLTKGIVQENKSNYNVLMEQNLFNASNVVENLIESLEKRTDENEAQ